jgi:hypothetical protein
MYSRAVVFFRKPDDFLSVGVYLIRLRPAIWLSDWLSVHEALLVLSLHATLPARR